MIGCDESRRIVRHVSPDHVGPDGDAAAVDTDDAAAIVDASAGDDGDCSSATSGYDRQPQRPSAQSNDDLDGFQPTSSADVDGFQSPTSSSYDLDGRESPTTAATHSTSNDFVFGVSSDVYGGLDDDDAASDVAFLSGHAIEALSFCLERREHQPEPTRRPRGRRESPQSTSEWTSTT